MDVLQEHDNLPNHFNKLISKIDILKDKILLQKNTIDEINNEFKNIDKILNKLVKKYNTVKIKTERKKTGFAVPTKISNELCDFINIPHGTLIARTDVTKFLNLYIKNHNLQNPNNKKTILPDDTLIKLFGENAINTVITYFNMQKFINHHFL